MKIEEIINCVVTDLFSFFFPDCLDHLLAAPLLICNFCHEIFQYLSPFQVHMQTCCNQPRELQQKMDQFAMDQLARSLWKSVFLKELKSMPISHSISKFYLTYNFFRFLNERVFGFGFSATRRVFR